MASIDQGLNRGWRHLTGIGWVGLLPCVIIDQRGLMPVERLIQSCQLGALCVLRDIVPQHGQFRQGLVDVALPQCPFGTLS